MMTRDRFYLLYPWHHNLKFGSGFLQILPYLKSLFQYNWQIWTYTRKLQNVPSPPVYPLRLSTNRQLPVSVLQKQQNRERTNTFPIKQFSLLTARKMSCSDKNLFTPRDMHTRKRVEIGSTRPPAGYYRSDRVCLGSFCRCGECRAPSWEGACHRAFK